MKDTIKTKEIKMFAAVRAIINILIHQKKYDGGGYWITFELDGERGEYESFLNLETFRGEVKVFKTVDAAVKAANEIDSGIAPRVCLIGNEWHERNYQVIKLRD